MMQQLMKWSEEGKLKPHIDKLYKITEYKEAFKVMNERKIVGKAVVQIQPEGSKAKL
jgi:NADPH2:quinone reductase